MNSGHQGPLASKLGIVRLVRVLTAIGLLTVAVFTGLVGWTLKTMRIARTRMAVERDQMDETSNVLRDRAIDTRNRLRAVLDEKAVLEDRKLIDAGLSEYIRTLTGTYTDADVQIALKQFTPLVVRVDDFSTLAYTWRGSYDLVWKDLSQQRTLERARSLIAQLRAAVETLEGRRRLEEAKRYRQWRAASGEEAQREARSILIEHARQESQGANDFKSELAECARLVELLNGEEQLDNFADLRDNKLKPVLDRLTSSIGVFAVFGVGQQTGAPSISTRELDALKVVLFGESEQPSDGVSLNKEFTRQPGLFGLRHDALRLRQDRERLRLVLILLFQDIERANAAFAQSAQLRSAVLAQEMEQRLTSDWWRMMYFGVGGSLVFLWLSWLILRGIRDQVTALEHARIEAEAGYQTTRALMEQQQAAAVKLTLANEALERSNNELKQFAYIASHDLQTPLRAICGFAQLLEADYHAKLDAKAVDYIDRIVKGVKRMQTVINDLLEYVRVDSRQRPFVATDLAGAFDESMKLMAAAIKESGGRVTCGPLPTVTGDPSQLSQMLQILVGNALKYRSAAPPEVHVSAERSERQWTIAVRDNGIGIDPKYHEQIFEIFRRLHSQEKYPGNGVGLAVCRRIAHRHGGRIWVESAAGKGCTFYFSILIEGDKI